jgi:hypothetical protein
MKLSMKLKTNSYNHKRPKNFQERQRTNENGAYSIYANSLY